jgi:hypothetical protein
VTAQTIDRPSMLIEQDAIVLWLRLSVRRDLEMIRTDCLQLPSNVVDALERIVAQGDAWAAELKRKLSNEVSTLDDSGFKQVQWTTVKDAAHELGDISTQAVGQMLRANPPRLHGEQIGRRWRVCVESVEARKEGRACQH